MVRSMFLTATQQLTWNLADSIHTLPNRYTTPGPESRSNVRINLNRLILLFVLNYRCHLCHTWLGVRVLKSIQPVKAEDLLPVGVLHLRELAGVDLHLRRSFTDAALLVLPPRTSNPAGPRQTQIGWNWTWSFVLFLLNRVRWATSSSDVNKRSLRQTIWKILTTEQDLGVSRRTPFWLQSLLQALTQHLLWLHVSPPPDRPPLVHQSPPLPTPWSRFLRNNTEEHVFSIHTAKDEKLETRPTFCFRRLLQLCAVLFQRTIRHGGVRAGWQSGGGIWRRRSHHLSL